LNNTIRHGVTYERETTTEVLGGHCPVFHSVLLEHIDAHNLVQQMLRETSFPLVFLTIALKLLSVITQLALHLRNTLHDLHLRF
jgi:hypothetical protein